MCQVALHVRPQSSCIQSPIAGLSVLHVTKEEEEKQSESQIPEVEEEESSRCERSLAPPSPAGGLRMWSCWSCNEYTHHEPITPRLLSPKKPPLLMHARGTPAAGVSLRWRVGSYVLPWDVRRSLGPVWGARGGPFLGRYLHRDIT